MGTGGHLRGKVVRGDDLEGGGRVGYIPKPAGRDVFPPIPLLLAGNRTGRARFAAAVPSLCMARACVEALLLLVLSGCADRPYFVRGVVRCAPADCGEPTGLSGVRVNLWLADKRGGGELRSGRTDAGGNYYFGMLAPPSWESRLVIEFSKPGYKTTELPLMPPGGMLYPNCEPPYPRSAVERTCRVINVDLQKER